MEFTRTENDIHISDRMADIAEDETTFYSNAEGYWKDIPPTVDGMLGGYGSISSIDISGSKAFLQKFIGVRKNVIDIFDWQLHLAYVMWRFKTHLIRKNIHEYILFIHISQGCFKIFQDQDLIFAWFPSD